MGVIGFWFWNEKASYLKSFREHMEKSGASAEELAEIDKELLEVDKKIKKK